MTRTTKATGKAKPSTTAKAGQPTSTAPAAKAPVSEKARLQAAKEPAGRKFESTEALAHFIQHNPEFGTLTLEVQDKLRGELVNAKRVEAEHDGYWSDGRKRLTLSENDALADLNGTRRPDNHVD
ncbi:MULTISPECIES: hypothetical protein [Comamonas]|jgi:hypothetical protein|uniref:hypothetical protein n=1 Tax=Comamonas TaxID=283 RepID=UPI002579D010|nr:MULTISPECIES: hypothetical protein [Comamonas]